VDQLYTIMHTLAMLGEFPGFEFSRVKGSFIFAKNNLSLSLKLSSGHLNILNN
jgi:hypothetical protein